MTTKSIARYIVIGSLFLIPFLSVYVANGMFFPFITGKNFLFRVLVEVAFVSWIVLAMADVRYRPRFSWTWVWYKCLVVWMIVANLMAVNAHKGFWSNYERMDGWVTLIHLYMFFVVMAAVLSAEKLWRKWWLAFVGGNALVAIYGLMQMSGIAAIHQSGTRIDASLGNAEYYAGYLLFAVAITIWQALETRKKDQTWLRYSLFALAFVQIVLLFATGTRGTMIGLIAAGFAGSALWIFEAGKQGRKTAVAVLAVLVLIVGGLFVARDSAFVTQSENLNRLASVFSLKEALGPRLTIWNMAIEGVKERPVTGWGQEGYNYVFNKYYEPSLYKQEPWFDRAHNVYLDWAIAGGIPALIFFLAVLLTAAFALYRAPVSRIERTLLLSALVGYAVQGLAVFDNLFTYIPLIAILAMAHMVSSRQSKLVDTIPSVQGTKLDTFVAPAALVAGVLLVWFVNMPSILASGSLIAGMTPSSTAQARFDSFKNAVEYGGLGHQEVTEQLISFATQAMQDESLPLEFRTELATYAEEQIKRELQRAPEDARLHLQYAVFLRLSGQLSKAQEESALASTFSPRKQTILIEQGAEAIQGADYAKAKEYFTRAYELDPQFTDIMGYVAGAHILDGDVAGAKALLQQTFGTTTINHQFLIVAYYETRDWNNLIDIVRLKAEETNDVSTKFQLAAAYSEAGRRDEAIAQVRKTIQEHPEAAQEGQAILRQLGATP